MEPILDDKDRIKITYNDFIEALLYYDRLKKGEQEIPKLSDDQWRDIARSGIESLGLGTIRK